MQQRDVFQQGQSRREPAVRRASPARVRGRSPRRRRRGRPTRPPVPPRFLRGAWRGASSPRPPASPPADRRRRLVASRRPVHRLTPSRCFSSPSRRLHVRHRRRLPSERPPNVSPERAPDVRARRQERDRLGRYRGELGHRIRRRALPNRHGKRHRAVSTGAKATLSQNPSSGSTAYAHVTVMATTHSTHAASRGLRSDLAATCALTASLSRTHTAKHQTNTRMARAFRKEYTASKMTPTGTVCSSHRAATWRSTPRDRAALLSSPPAPSRGVVVVVPRSSALDVVVAGSSPSSARPVMASSSRFISRSLSSLRRSVVAASVAPPSPLVLARSALAASRDSSDLSARSRSETVRAPPVGAAPANASRMR